MVAYFNVANQFTIVETKSVPFSEGCGSLLEKSPGSGDPGLLWSVSHKSNTATKQAPKPV
jgi:hypothetical protein